MWLNFELHILNSYKNKNSTMWLYFESHALNSYKNKKRGQVPTLGFEPTTPWIPSMWCNNTCASITYHCVGLLQYMPSWPFLQVWLADASNNHPPLRCVFECGPWISLSPPHKSIVLFSHEGVPLSLFSLSLSLKRQVWIPSMKNSTT